jgi:hypothetical protein
VLNGLTQRIPLGPVSGPSCVGNNLSKAGWSWGCVSALDSQKRTIWIVDAHRDDESVSLCVPIRS